MSPNPDTQMLFGLVATLGLLSAATTTAFLAPSGSTGLRRAAARAATARRFGRAGVQMMAGEKKYQVVLVRHGESTWNDENRFTGWYDCPLSEKGLKEAREAGKILKVRGVWGYRYACGGIAQGRDRGSKVELAPDRPSHVHSTLPTNRKRTSSSTWRTRRCCGGPSTRCGWCWRSWT